MAFTYVLCYVFSEKCSTRLKVPGLKSPFSLKNLHSCFLSMCLHCIVTKADIFINFLME